MSTARNVNDFRAEKSFDEFWPVEGQFVTVTELPIVAFAPRIYMSLGTQCKTMFSTGIDCDFFDEYVLNGFEEGGYENRIYAADTEPANGSVS